MRIRELLAAGLHLIFPVPCHACGRPLDGGRRSGLCGGCWSRLERMPPAGCARCGWPFPAPGGSAGAPDALCLRCRQGPDDFDVARAVLRYREGGIARAAILLGKHGRRMPLLRHLARLLAEEGPRYLDLQGWDLVVPVPLHWRRRWQRGLNQAEVLARAVGARHGLPVAPRLLVRVRATPPQQGDGAARARNVRGAFRVRTPARVAGRRLLLVDDVFTTGATANACARSLREAGAAAVGVLTLARVE